MVRVALFVCAFFLASVPKALFGVVVMSTAAVPSAGTTAVVTFSRSVTGVSASDYHFEVNNRRISVASVSGSGTSWTFTLTAPRYFAAGEALRVSYEGTATIDDLSDPLPKSSKTVTNNSSVSYYQKRFVEWQIGAFIHFSPSTFLNTQVDQGTESPNTFNPSALDIDQIIATAVAMKARYVCLTTKHSGGFCLWVTAVTPHNITAGSWYAAHGNTDVVGAFVTKARAAGLGIGLYLATGDYWWENVRPGHDGTYGGTYNGNTFTQHIIAMITELLTNYGTIDFIWSDGAAYVRSPPFSIMDYTAVRAAITAIQPNCLFIDNSHDGTLNHADIAEHELTSQSEPDSGNTIPAETIQTGLINDNWFWNTGLETYRTPQDIADQAARLKAARSAFMINLAPNSTGVIPAAGVTFAQAVGALLPGPDAEYLKPVGAAR